MTASPSPGRATMRDVAALAGVSIKTVSRVVNDEPGVAPAVRRKVTAAVSQLDYRHHLAASNLRRGTTRSGLIGALVQDVTNSYSAALLRSLENAARDRGSAILAASLDEEPDRERTLVHDLVTRRVDGLILMPSTHRQDYLSSEMRAGMPVVFVDREPSGVAADSVTVENVGGAAMGVDHLLSQGHRRIACLTDLDEIFTARQRRQGYLNAFAAHGIRPDPKLLIQGLRGPASAEEATLSLLERADPPTAIFAARNDLCQGAARALRTIGEQHNVALLGFDDFPLADLMEPSLTVIRQDVQRIGRMAADMLMRRLDGESGPPRHVVVEPALVARGSGEIPPSP